MYDEYDNVEEYQQGFDKGSEFPIFSIGVDRKAELMVEKGIKLSRTDEEKTEDVIVRLCLELDLSQNIINDVLSYVPRIPDIKYKSAMGIIFGVLSKPYLGKELTENEKERFNQYVLSKLNYSEKLKKYKFNEIDIVRYAKLISRISVY